MILSSIQPSFLPWLGYFEQMERADFFVHLDDVQYTRKDWRNRNRFLTPQGAVEYLSVPVAYSHRNKTLIKDVQINGQPGWQRKMTRRLEAWYGKAPAFQREFPMVRDILSRQFTYLSELNCAMTAHLMDRLGISTPVAYSSDLSDKLDGKNEKIIAICRHYGADVLYDGAAAASFIDVDLFRRHDIEVVFQDYRAAAYHQAGSSGFVSHLSALDAIFNIGGETARNTMLASPVPSTLARTDIARD